LARAVVTQFEQYVKLNKKVPPEVLVSLSQIDDPGKLADTVSAHLSLKISDKQDLLETFDLGRLAAFVTGLLGGLLGLLTNLAFILTLVLFMCVDSGAFSRQLRAAREHHAGVVEALESFVRGTRKYFVVSTVFGLIVAVLDTAVLWRALCIERGDGDPGGAGVVGHDARRDPRGEADGQGQGGERPGEPLQHSVTSVRWCRWDRTARVQRAAPRRPELELGPAGRRRGRPAGRPTTAPAAAADPLRDAAHRPGRARGHDPASRPDVSTRYRTSLFGAIGSSPCCIESQGDGKGATISSGSSVIGWRKTRQRPCKATHRCRRSSVCGPKGSVAPYCTSPNKG
jgi:hypothetical protein